MPIIKKRESELFDALKDNNFAQISECANFYKEELDYYVNAYLENAEKWRLISYLAHDTDTRTDIHDLLYSLINKLENILSIYSITIVVYGIKENFVYSTKQKNIDIFKKTDFIKAKEIKDTLAIEVEKEGTKFGYFILEQKRKHDIQEDLNFLNVIAEYIAIILKRQELYVKLKRENEEKIQFLSSLSHEFNGTLKYILDSVQSLKLSVGEYNKSSQRYLQNIQSGTEYLLSFMINAIDDTKLEYENLDIKKESFYVKSKILSAVDAFKMVISEKNIDVVAMLSDTKINFNLIKFNQILYDIMASSINFANKNCKLQLTNWVSDEKFYFEIESPGKTISRKLRDRLFEYNIHSTSPQLGCGLALCKRIIEANGGEINFVSKNGNVGFCFYIPIS